MGRTPLQAVGIPDGIFASLTVFDATSTHLSIQRQPLTSSTEFGSNFALPSGFSGTVTLDIFNSKGVAFDDYGSVSIVLFAAGGQGHLDTLLGAEHVVFDEDLD